MLLVVLGGVAVGVSISRPVIGVAIAFVLVPIGNVGLVGIPSLADSEAPVWLLPLAWTAFIFLVSLARLSAGPRREEPPRLLIVLGLYLAAALGATAFVDDLSAAIPLLRSLFTGFLLFLSVAFVVRTRTDVQWILGGIALTAAIIGAYAGYQYTSGYAGSEGFITTSGELVQRATGGLGHPNAAGGFFAMLAPLIVVGGLLARRGRSLYMVAFGLALVGLYVSFSRASLLALALAPIFLLRDRRTLLLVPLLVVLLLTAAPSLVEERFATLTSDGSELATRADFFRTAQFIWTQQPVLGVGLGGFPEAYADARLAGKQFLPTTVFQPPPDAHNIFLQLLAEQGVIGLLALLGLLTVAVRSALTVAKVGGWAGTFGIGVLAVLAVFLVTNQFSVTFLEVNATIFVGILGLLSAVHAIALREEVDAGSDAPTLRQTAAQ
ncbi:MAG: O-antigen ligase family protein [Actinomycetota bacterium]|nr:O-antigen ligase family protein [Actinomycetota bacterium]